MGKVGFIGLGAMGSRMARNLVKGGRRLMVYDLESERVEAIVKEVISSASENRGSCFV